MKPLTLFTDYLRLNYHVKTKVYSGSHVPLLLLVY